MQPCSCIEIRLTCEKIHVVVKIQTHRNQSLYMEFKKSCSKTDLLTKQSVALKSFVISLLQCHILYHPPPSGKSVCCSSVVTSVNAPVYGGSKKVVLGCVT